MAFGKRSLERLPPEVRAQLEENYINKMADKTLGKMLKVPARGTPLGDDHFLRAVEVTMTAPAQACSICLQEKTDTIMSLTGACEACWIRQNIEA